MVERSLTRTLVAVTLTATTVLALASAANADTDNSRSDKVGATEACTAHEGTYTEVSVADGSISSCTFGKSFEACGYDGSGAATGSESNCTELTGASAKPYRRLLATLIASVDSLQDGEGLPTRNVARGKTISIRKGMQLRIKDLAKFCENNGGTYHGDAGGGDCSTKGGKLVDCFQPPPPKGPNCGVYRTTGTEPLGEILHDLIREIGVLLTGPTQSGGGGGSGGGGSVDTGSTTSTTQGTPGTKTTKPTIPDPGGTTPPASGPTTPTQPPIG